MAKIRLGFVHTLIQNIADGSSIEYFIFLDRIVLHEAAAQRSLVVDRVQSYFVGTEIYFHRGYFGVHVGLVVEHNAGLLD